MRPSEKNQDKNALLRAFFYPFVFVIILWLIKLTEFIFNIHLASFGMLPRSLMHLPGIISMPLLHANFKHLISNSFPLLVLGGFVFYFYKAIAWKVVFWIYFLSGLWLWIGGRPLYHIGASGLVYGFASFLFFSGIFKRNSTLMAVSLIIIFLYGSMIWGFFPEFFPDENISWEGHLFGFLAGTLMAFYYRKSGPQKPVYDWNEEDEDSEQENTYWEIDLPVDKDSIDKNARPAYFRKN